MGTRSLTHIQEEGKTILTLYRQYDGYPEGHGLDMAQFIAKGTVTNGFGDRRLGTQFNGIGDLAAQLIQELKTETGNLYVYAPNSKDCGEEFTYTINLNSAREITITCVDDWGNKVFSGSPTDWVNKYQKDDSLNFSIWNYKGPERNFLVTYLDSGFYSAIEEGSPETPVTFGVTPGNLYKAVKAMCEAQKAHKESLANA